MKNKLAKFIWKIEKWARRGSAPKKEFSLANSEHKEYVRAKRNEHNLPCFENTGTRWIKKIKNWKHRSKVSHQWEKHQLSYHEKQYLLNDENKREQILYYLGKLKDDEWLQCDNLIHYTNTINEMILNKEIEPCYYVDYTKRNCIILYAIRLYNKDNK